MAATYYTLTGVHRGNGDLSAAKRYAEEALPLLQRLGLRRIEGLLLYQLTVVYIELGDYQLAMAYALQSIELLRSVRDNLNCAYALLRLGDLYQKFSRPEQSQIVWQEALECQSNETHPT
ncbi:MAG: tetratricopeptide repeat protein [Caldilineaceae bacterium]